MDKYTIMARLLVLFTAMPIHECAHGLVADRLGDHTARSQGRLTLNPFAHLDPIGSIMILLMGFGWARPVPVNPYYFRKNSRTGMALTAAAGPAANLLLAAAVLLVAKLLMVFAPAMLPFASLMLLISILVSMCQINLGLAVFNLLPIYPLDGSRIFAVFLPDWLVDKMERNQQAIYYVFLALLLFTPILDWPLGILSGLMLTGIDMVTSLFGLLPRLV